MAKILYRGIDPLAADASGEKYLLKFIFSEIVADMKIKESTTNRSLISATFSWTFKPHIFQKDGNSGA